MSPQPTSFKKYISNLKYSQQSNNDTKHFNNFPSDYRSAQFSQYLLPVLDEALYNNVKYKSVSIIIHVTVSVKLTTWNKFHIPSS